MQDNTVHETSGITTIVNLMAKFSASFTAISIIGYFIGYKLDSRYLSYIDAQWAIELLSFSELLRASSTIFITLLLGFLSSISIPVETNNRTEYLRKVERVLGIIAVLLLFLSAYFSHYEKITLALLSDQVAILFFIYACAFTMGELVGNLEESGLRWNTYHTSTIIYLLSTLFIVIPSISINQAKIDMNISETKLKKVCLDTSCKGEWHLVRSIGDNFLIVNLKASKRYNEFRLIPITEVTIHSQNRKY